MTTAPQKRSLAAGEGWQIDEYSCHAGPSDRPFEERHHGVAISAVAEGSFIYHGERGRALLTPGALLLGNNGACFMCGHDHGVGDRCISLKLAPDFFAEIAASCAGTARYRFAASHLPATSKRLALAIRFEAFAGARPDDEQVIAVAETVIAEVTGCSAGIQRVSARDEARIAAAVRTMELHSREEFRLQSLAAVAGLSKYHFLRLFRALIGMTPYQYVLGLRLRRAALRLADTADPVSAIAFEEGFGDLSTFNRRFRHHFGQSPSSYRRKAA